MQLSMREAIRLAMQEEMRADAGVVVFGEDVAEAGGVFKITAGLLEEFGPSRVRDTPIAETAILGAAIGAAARGLRPVVEIMFAEFFGVALDQVVTEAAKTRYLSNGRIGLPMVIRTSAGSGLSFGAQHSGTLESWFLNTPGLIVVSPSSASRAYGLLRAAIRADDPVIFIEPRVLYGAKDEVDPASWRDLTLGRAIVAREGTDLTLVGLGQTVRIALDAASALGGELSCEVIDLATILPWDRDAVFASARKTGRFATIEENPRTGGWGAEVVSAVAETCYADLAAPVLRLTAPDAPVPFGSLEKSYLPTADEAAAAIRELVRSESAPAARWSGWRAGPARPAAADGSRDRRAALERPLARYERLCEIRAFEDAVQTLFAEGLIPGTTHTCQGQEAIAVGLAAATGPDDAVTCTYRGHGVALALGMPPEVVMSEILGRVSGCVGGKGGSMHLVDPDVGLLPTYAVVGAGLPVATGAAFASQVKGDGRIAVAVFGDGATNIGAFHESLNLASVWRLPIVFVCENNLYGEYTRIDRTTPTEDLVERAAGYRMPGRAVDGQDLDAVMRAVADAARAARAGEGPTLLEMKTYRFTGHSRGDPAKYRPAGELERWKERDPIALYQGALHAAGTAPAELASARARAEERVARAVAYAKDAPAPEPGDILTHVLAGR